MSKSWSEIISHYEEGKDNKSLLNAPLSNNNSNKYFLINDNKKNEFDGFINSIFSFFKFKKEYKKNIS